ncbi:MAG TPA: EutN/CcmL family microcompartment protein, partial [Bdellovibrionales bacterium]|nr:EutN/CcmL family microcompartment protein [Bdellovibrionales bacterium]
MIMARVKGPVVATQKHNSFHGRRILVVEPLDQNLKKNSTELLAFDDDIRPAPGDVVLVCREGGGCRMIWNDKDAPVNSVVVG